MSNGNAGVKSRINITPSSLSFFPRIRDVANNGNQPEKPSVKIIRLYCRLAGGDLIFSINSPSQSS